MHKLILTLTLGFLAFILWVIFLANTGSSSIFFDFVRHIPYGDKLGHIGLFGMLTLLTTLVFRFRSLDCRYFKIYYGVIAVTLFVLFEETSQAFIPSRTFDYADLAADGVGILFATLLALVIDKFSSIKAGSNSQQNSLD